jgi:hypothetical protein
MKPEYDDWQDEEEEIDWDVEEYHDDFPIRTVNRQEISDAVRLFAWELSLIKEKELQGVFLLGKPSYLDVKKAYRLLAHAHHPDKGGDHQNIQKINEAYEILSSVILPDGTEKEESNFPVVKRISKMEHPDVRAIVTGIKDYFRTVHNSHPNITKELITLNSRFRYSDLSNYWDSKEENRIEFRGDELYNIAKTIYYAFDLKSYEVSYGKNKTKSYPHYKLWYLINLIMEKSEDEKREGLGGFEVNDVVNTFIRMIRDNQLILVDEGEHKSKMMHRRKISPISARNKKETIKRHIFRKNISG